MNLIEGTLIGINRRQRNLSHPAQEPYAGDYCSNIASQTADYNYYQFKNSPTTVILNHGLHQKQKNNACDDNITDTKYARRTLPPTLSSPAISDESRLDDHKNIGLIPDGNSVCHNLITKDYVSRITDEKTGSPHNESKIDMSASTSKPLHRLQDEGMNYGVRQEYRNKHMLPSVCSPIIYAVKNIIGTLIKQRETHQRKVLRKRLSSNLLMLQCAKSESLLRKSDLATKKRTSNFHHLGDFGMALFSPLDGAYELDAEFLTTLLKDEKYLAETLFSNNIQSPIMRTISSVSSFFDCMFNGGNDTGDGDDTPSLLGDDISLSSQLDDFEPVLVQSESPEALKASPFILLPEHMRELVDRAFPPVCRSKMWVRLFSVSRDGDSIGTFVRKVKGNKNTLLVIRTTQNIILGCFADAAWEEQPGFDGRTYFGGGESFLFKVKQDKMIPSDLQQANNHKKCSDENDTNEWGCHKSLEEEEYHCDNNDDKTINIYRWQGANDYNQLLVVNNEGRLAMGGGGHSGSFGLCVEDYFGRGTSGACATFGNPPLGHVQDKTDFGENDIMESYFEILELEIFGFSYDWI